MENNRNYPDIQDAIIVVEEAMILLHQYLNRQ